MLADDGQNVGRWVVQRRVMVGAMSGDGWQTVGRWVVQRRLIVGAT